MSSTKESGGKFTALGTNIFQWEPWTSLSHGAARLWLVLYASAEAKRMPPGLWHGGPGVMAEAGGMRADDTLVALDELVISGMVEYDRHYRVARLTKLPDAHERACSWTHVKSWWTKFNLTPKCDVRDSHIKTLRWLIDQGNVPEGMERVWADTFATVKVVPVNAKRRGVVRRISDSDTSTALQPSLFPNPTHSRASDPTPPNDPHPLTRESNDFNTREGVSDTPSEGVSEGVGEGEGDSSFLSSPESEQGEPPVDRDPVRHRLALVPPPAVPFTADELAEVFGRRTLPWPPGTQERLTTAISELAATDVGFPDLALLREAIGAGVMPEVYLDDRHYVGWERVHAMREPGALLEAFQKARVRRIRIDEQRKAFADLREKAGV